MSEDEKQRKDEILTKMSLSNSSYCIDDTELIDGLNIMNNCSQKLLTLKEFAITLRVLVADDYSLTDIMEGPRRNIRLTSEQKASIETMKQMRVEFLHDIILILEGNQPDVMIPRKVR